MPRQQRTAIVTRESVLGGCCRYSTDVRAHWRHLATLTPEYRLSRVFYFLGCSRCCLSARGTSAVYPDPSRSFIALFFPPYLCGTRCLSGRGDTDDTQIGQVTHYPSVSCVGYLNRHPFSLSRPRPLLFLCRCKVERIRKQKKGTAAASWDVQRSASSRIAHRKTPTDAFRLPRAASDGESLVFSVSITTGKHRVIVIIRFEEVHNKTTPIISCTGKACKS